MSVSAAFAWQFMFYSSDKRLYKIRFASTLTSHSSFDKTRQQLLHAYKFSTGNSFLGTVPFLYLMFCCLRTCQYSVLEKKFIARGLQENISIRSKWCRCP